MAGMNAVEESMNKAAVGYEKFALNVRSRVFRAIFHYMALSSFHYVGRSFAL
jgi:hypothetical protein